MSRTLENIPYSNIAQEYPLQVSIEDPIDFIKKQKCYNPYLVKKQYDILFYDKNIEFVILKHLARGSSMCIENIDITIIDNLDVHSTYEIDFCDSSQYRFIYGNITLYFSFSDEEEEEDTHAMAILIDNYYKEIEVFEPQGAIADWYKPVMWYLEDTLSKAYPDYRFMPNADLCPYFGIQYKSMRPICASITLLFFWSRIVNPNLRSHDLVNKLLSHSQRELNIILDKFICYIYQYATMFHLIDK